MTQTYIVRAYDSNHHELWITIGSSHVGAEPCRRVRGENLPAVYAITKTGQIIDPETGYPVIRQRNPETGRKSQGRRRVAYFRTYAVTHGAETIAEIHITKHGRQTGIRNYQTRRPDDERAEHAPRITGWPPIHTGPRIESTGTGSYRLVIGEGDVDCLCGTSRSDQWGDTAVVIATCHKILRRETGHWWGFAYHNRVTGDHCPMEEATGSIVRKHLEAIGQETISERGDDPARW